MPAPGRPVRRRTLLAALYAAGVTLPLGCAGTEDTVERDLRDVEDLFGDPAPRTSTPDAPTGPYPVGAPLRLPYDPPDGPAAPDTVGDLHVPTVALDRLPVVVLVHGGGWTLPGSLDYTTPIARDLASAGLAVWNVEYRRVGGGGGWPTTLTDVAAAVDAVAALPGRTGLPLDVDDVHVVGHSAGGHLAGWVAGRPGLPAGAPGSAPGVRVRSAVTLAGVLDLALALDSGKDRFVRAFLGGGDDQVPERYALASPVDSLPTGIPVTCVHGLADTTVDPEQARTYVARATAAGDPASLLLLPDVDHGGVADVGSASWPQVRDVVLRQVRATRP